ncbi:MAG: glycosyltransferase [Zoogloeaceae bacterium]|jgi:glycosyltransferase involved in cell wall biosynthesis|nr:glycosyltransferase [Zoogloeaceae bacterium]
MKISVVIPMFNEARHIGRTLASICRAADCADIECELLAADNGSTDDGARIAAAHGARVLDCPGVSIGALRNRGADLATGDWLAFIDADIEVPPDWLAIWRGIHARDEADVLALACDTPAEAPWFARVWQYRDLAVGQRDWLTTQNLCMARSWLERVGGFDERLRAGEDKDFTLRLRRAGARLLSLPAPTVMHWGYERSWREWLGKEYWRQSGHLQLIGADASLRVLRFPLLCAGVASSSLFLLAAALICSLPVALALLPGLLAAFGFALRQRAYRHPIFMAQLMALHWLRLHITALALLSSLLGRHARRPERG